jgi:hypothetical protein
MAHDIVRGDNESVPWGAHPYWAKNGIGAGCVIAIDEISFSSEMGFFDFSFADDLESPAQFADDPHDRESENIIKGLLDNPV